MPDDNEMTLDERRKYLKKMKPLYDQSNRQERGQLLTQMEHVTGLHRKSLTRLLGETSLERHLRSKQRTRTYGVEFERVVLTIWENLDYICAERLTPALPKMAEHLARFGVLDMSEEIGEQLHSVSRATVARLLSGHRNRQYRLPQRGPELANQVTKGVPMGRIPWDIQQPGHFEVDLVHHAGSCTQGEYLHTLQMVDVATGWSERVAVLGRSQRAMEAGFRLILQRLPFPVKHLHPDNGSEFFNQHLVRFWGEEIAGVQLSRSRPYHKNDNRMVEQKNETLVRQYFGHERLEADQFEAMNRLYDQMWNYYNLFQPVMHLKEKRFEHDQVKRRWDEARTPFERLIQTQVLQEEHAQRLQDLYERTNPYLLRKRIYRQLEQMWPISAQPQRSAAPEQAAVATAACSGGEFFAERMKPAQ